MRRVKVLYVCFLLAHSGCGGGGGNHSSGAGRAEFRILWPADSSRLIPAASNSIVVTLRRSGVFLESKTVARPAGGGPALISFENLPVAQITAVAAAFPNSDGSGIAQASGSVTFAVTAGATVPFGITMGSTIDHLEVTPATLTLNPNQEQTLSVAAKDSTGNIVLISASKLEWTSNPQNAATVDSTGKVRGVSAGTAVITVTDSESGKSATATVNVNSGGNVIFNPANGHYYESVPHGGPLTWTAAKNLAAARMHAGLQGHLLTENDQAEATWVAQNVDVQLFWVGGYQDTTAPDYSETLGGWRWITGEPMNFTNWNGGEPNDGNALSNFMHIFPGSGGRWNDTEHDDFNITGYLVEYE